MVGFCVLTLLFGIYLQVQSFPTVKWEKSVKVEWSIPFSIGFSFVFNGAGIAFFGRPYWPAAIQFLCFLFSFVIVNFLAKLSAWWDRFTMMLMLVGVLVEYIRYRRRGR
jgi:hypothetical protein